MKKVGTLFLKNSRRNLLFKDLNDEDSITDPYFVIADRDDDLTLLKEADNMEFLAKPGINGISGGISESDCLDFFTEFLKTSIVCFSSLFSSKVNN